MKLTKLLSAAVFVSAAFVLLFTAQPTSALSIDDYQPGRIIDDSVFRDTETMSLNDVQVFLTEKGSGLASMSFVLNCLGSDSQERQLYTAAGAPCDQTVLASSIIYYASQAYGINPQVILSTLQKEQGLITSPNPTAWQVDQAMGYGCGNPQACSGFFNQIDFAVWAFRYHFERASGNYTWWNTSTGWVCGNASQFYAPSLQPGQNVDFYDNQGVLYTTILIENAATSALYCYTPYAYNNPDGLYGFPVYGTTGQFFSGQYNFLRFYTEWFGSPLVQEDPHTFESVIDVLGGNQLVKQVENAQRFYDRGDNEKSVSMLQKVLESVDRQLSQNKLTEIDASNYTQAINQLIDSL